MNNLSGIRRLGVVKPLAALCALSTAACFHVHVDPLEVKPITLNVNVKYVDDSLDNFYNFQKKYDQPAATTQDMTQPTAPTAETAKP